MPKHLAVTRREVSIGHGGSASRSFDWSFFSATLMDSFQLLNSFDFRFPMCFLFMTSSVMKHPLFSTGNTHTQLGDFEGKTNASSEGHSRWNPWRRYSFNHRASGHPARSYMLRWGHLLGTRSEIQGWHSIREVPCMLYILLHLPL